MTAADAAARGKGLRAVVFAYHNVGVRCLQVLLAHEVDVALVVTHEDAAQETIWFQSVAGLAAEHGIPVIAPSDVNAREVHARVAAAKPDMIFSFYYRQILGAALLALAPRGGLNMHGSLLPLYRGRAPVNWAIIHGERETGATLHEMKERPDSGDIVAQMAVPILPEDNAQDVFAKVTLAAEITLDRALPSIIAGNAPRTPQDLARGRYFGGRKPEDGVIDWRASARDIHNLVRAVAPPYPGALTRILERPARVLRTRILDPATPPTLSPSMRVADGRIVAECGGGGTLVILALEVDGEAMTADAFARRSRGRAVPPGQ